MSDLDYEELVATKRLNKVKPSEREEALGLLDHWKTVYDIPLYEIDKVRKFIEE